MTTWLPDDALKRPCSQLPRLSLRWHRVPDASIRIRASRAREGAPRVEWGADVNFSPLD